jgi:hypothetical protein
MNADETAVHLQRAARRWWVAAACCVVVILIYLIVGVQGLAGWVTIAALTVLAAALFAAGIGLWISAKRRP